MSCPALAGYQSACSLQGLDTAGTLAYVGGGNWARPWAYRKYQLRKNRKELP